jgi:hypothetical protein
LWLSGGVTFLWMLLGSWVAVFPSTIESSLTWIHNNVWSAIPAVDYGNFHDVWGLSQTRFEVFTLGTLGLVIAFGVVGYLIGSPVRRRQVDLPLETSLEPAAGD